MTKDLNKIYILTAMIWIMTFFLICFTDSARGDEVKDITDIIYAEHSNPKVTNALLNTYYSTRKPKDTLLKSLQKNSCAYRFQSIQYTKARRQLLTLYEKKVYTKIYLQVKNFKPDSKWKYVKHESPSFYKNKETMIAHLKQKWGNEINYNYAVLIEGEYFFSLRKDKSTWMTHLSK